MGGDLGRIKMWVRRVKEVPPLSTDLSTQRSSFSGYNHMHAP
jgi:hypothetical protein